MYVLFRDKHGFCFMPLATTDRYKKEASRTFPLNEVGKAAAIQAAVGFGGNDFVPKSGGLVSRGDSRVWKCGHRRIGIGRHVLENGV